MTRDPDWNDAARNQLRDALCEFISGEVRLGRADRHEIIESCREVHIEDQCPERERAEFVGFARNILDNALAQHLSDQSNWPEETDCDRLDQVEADLRDRGILFWQLSPCCDTCTGAELPDRIEEVDNLHPGFRDRVRGYAFFIDQNMAEMLAESAEISVYLAYGWFAPEDSDPAENLYESKALGIAEEVCDSIRSKGLVASWNGSHSKKIGVRLTWLRRRADTDLPRGFRH